MSLLLLALAAALMFIGYELMAVTWWYLEPIGLGLICLLVASWLQGRKAT
jgi:hypothetical protein